MITWEKCKLSSFIKMSHIQCDCDKQANRPIGGSFEKVTKRVIRCVFTRNLFFEIISREK